MRKTILTVLASALIIASAASGASANENHRARHVARTAAPVSDSVRNATDYVPVQSSDYSRYQNGAYSAPAGR